MPRATIERTTTSNAYNELRVASGNFHEHNDCAVVAVALVAGVSYAEAHAALAAEGRKNRRGTYIYQTLNALKRLGKTTTQKRPGEYIAQYPAGHQGTKNVTTHHPRRFPGVFDPNKRYLFRTTRHILAVIGGEVNDWTINKVMRVHDIYEVN